MIEIGESRSVHVQIAFSKGLLWAFWRNSDKLDEIRTNSGLTSCSNLSNSEKMKILVWICSNSPVFMPQTRNKLILCIQCFRCFQCLFVCSMFCHRMHRNWNADQRLKLLLTAIHQRHKFWIYRKRTDSLAITPLTCRTNEIVKQNCINFNINNKFSCWKRNWIEVGFDSIGSKRIDWD